MLLLIGAGSVFLLSCSVLVRHGSVSFSIGLLSFRSGSLLLAVDRRSFPSGPSVGPSVGRSVGRCWDAVGLIWGCFGWHLVRFGDDLGSIRK